MSSLSRAAPPPVAAANAELPSTHNPHLHVVRSFTAKTVAADCTTALAVAFTAALPISIIDYSIMARVAGITNSSLRELVRGFKTLLLRPHKFFLPCAENKCCLVYCVCVTSYGLTYIGSNLSKSYFQSHGRESQANLAAGVSSGVINTLLSIWKDSIILRALPPANPNEIKGAQRPVPWLTRGLFACRDILTCVGAFTFAPMVAHAIAPYVRHRPFTAILTGHTDTMENAVTKDAMSEETQPKISLPLSSDDTAQLLTPVALQLVTTLFHITAIRYRQTYPNFTLQDFNKSVKATYVSATLLRMCRIIPAFGLGGIMNRNMRSDLLDLAEPTLTLPSSQLAHPASSEI